MPTTSYVDATDIKIFVDGEKIAKITSGTCAISADERDRRNNDGHGWMDRGYGTRSSSISGDAFFEFDAAYGYLDLLDIMLQKKIVEVVWNAGVVGDKQLRAEYILQQLDQSGSTGEDLKYSYTLNSTSPLIVEAVAAS
jgi:hypothetical protein